MRNMSSIGNKYEITVFEWFEQLAKAEKRLDESIECNRRFGDNEEWIAEDTEKVNKINTEIEEVKAKLESMKIHIDYEKLKNLAKEEVYSI